MGLSNFLLEKDLAGLKPRRPWRSSFQEVGVGEKIFSSNSNLFDDSTLWYNHAIVAVVAFIEDINGVDNGDHDGDHDGDHGDDD